MTETPATHLRGRNGWIALRIVLAIEAVGGAWLVWNVVQGFFAAQGEPLGDRLSILISTLLFWGWILLTLWGAMKARPSWARGSAITIHILIFAAATGVLQGFLGPQTFLGLELLLLAFAGFIAAMFARPAEPEVPAA